MSDALKPQNLTPKEAFEMLQKNPQAVLIDIRSTMEHLMIGHPKDAIHIAWLDEPDWTANPRFVAQVREVLLGGFLGADEEKPPAVILICRSGRRSIEAGTRLLEAGIPNIYNVVSGFEGPLDEDHHRSTTSGWRHDDLPWQQC
ncbi:MAG: rhodanese-like domain-containing protein [Gammaproteobacteria bacterium]|nr:rhodanese-like domain-containing protein [Gammaproteobacteria bacterium]